MSSESFDTTSDVEKLFSYVSSASSAVNKSGVLTEEVYESVAIWFTNVDVLSVSPFALPQISDAERTTLAASVLGDMTTAIRNTMSLGLSEFDAFEHLTPILDPLWCELYTLRPASMATIIITSKILIGPDVEKIIEKRIVRLELMSGRSRQDFVTQAAKDPEKVAKLLSAYGLTSDDIGVPR